VLVTFGCTGKVNEGVDVPRFLTIERKPPRPEPQAGPPGVPAWALPSGRPTVAPAPPPTVVRPPRIVGQPMPRPTPRVTRPSPPRPAATPKPRPTVRVPPTARPTSTPWPTPTPAPTEAPESLAIAPGYVPRSTAITYRIPVGDLDDLSDLEGSVAIREILGAMLRNERLELFIATYVSREDASRRHAQPQTVAEYLFLRVAKFFASRGVDPVRIRGKGMGADPDVGRGIVAYLEVGGPTLLPTPAPDVPDLPDDEEDDDLLPGPVEPVVRPPIEALASARVGKLTQPGGSRSSRSA
jgi:hypothetical protein